VARVVGVGVERVGDPGRLLGAGAPERSARDDHGRERVGPSHRRQGRAVAAHRDAHHDPSTSGADALGAEREELVEQEGERIAAVCPRVPVAVATRDACDRQTLTGVGGARHRRDVLEAQAVGGVGGAAAADVQEDEQARLVAVAMPRREREAVVGAAAPPAPATSRRRRVTAGPSGTGPTLA